jgi:hypothetical protein
MASASPPRKRVHRRGKQSVWDLQDLCCLKNTTEHEQGTHKSVVCSVCDWRAVICARCSGAYYSGAQNNYDDLWHSRKYEGHALRCPANHHAGAGATIDSATAGPAFDDDGRCDISDCYDDPPDAPVLPPSHEAPASLPMHYYGSAADATAAVALAGLPPGTLLNPAGHGRPHWPPSPEFFARQQPHTAVAAAVFDGCGGAMHAGSITDADAALVVHMRQLYAGLGPLQREQLAGVLGGVDRCARRNATAQAGAAATAATLTGDLARALAGGEATAARAAQLEREVQMAMRTEAERIYFCPPLTAADMRRVLHGGPRSLSAALPKPRTHDLGDGHCVANIADIIAIMLAGGANVSYINEWAGPQASHIWQGRTAQRVLRVVLDKHGSHLVIHITEWSDDWQPNHTKTNRASVWTMTMSIGKPAGPDSDANVFVVATSAKGLDHEPAFEHVRRQLEELAVPQLFWHSGVQATVLVSAHVVAKIADDPETRAKVAQTGGCRRGFTGATSALRAGLAACKLCAPYVISGRVPPGTACTKCAAWDYGARVLRAPAPTAYPFDDIREIAPAPLSFDYLVKAVTSIYGMLRHTDAGQRWTTAKAVSLMEVLKIQEKARARILVVATGGGVDMWFPSNWLSGLGPCAVLQANHIPEAMHLWHLGACELLAFVLLLLHLSPPLIVCTLCRCDQVVL